jgi:hypothetical protein
MTTDVVTLAVYFCPCADGDWTPCPSPNSLPRTLKGSGTSTGVVDCLRFELFGFREDDNRDVVESFESRDKEDDLGLNAGRLPA